jgi:hypothetical protein
VSDCHSSEMRGVGTKWNRVVRFLTEQRELERRLFQVHCNHPYVIQWSHWEGQVGTLQEYWCYMGQSSVQQDRHSHL